MYNIHDIGDTNVIQDLGEGVSRISSTNVINDLSMSECAPNNEMFVFNQESDRIITDQAAPNGLLEEFEFEEEDQRVEINQDYLEDSHVDTNECISIYCENCLRSLLITREKASAQ